MAANQLEVRGSRGWYSILIAGTDCAILMALPMRKPDAVKVARWLDSLTDWSRKPEELAADRELTEAVVGKRTEILNAYYAKGPGSRPDGPSLGSAA